MRAIVQRDQCCLGTKTSLTDKKTMLRFLFNGGYTVNYTYIFARFVVVGYSIFQLLPGTVYI